MMERLIEAGLMFGNLIEVSSPTMVARYNAALEKLIGKRTGLEDFHIDLSGFSPEVGDELDDIRYLNPEGCNRMFILLSLDQLKAPLLNAQFSTMRSVLRNFIQDNAKELMALSVREAVMGELVHSMWRIKSPADLLELRTVTVEANTPTDRLGEAEQLSRLIEDFRVKDDLWQDDAYIDGMIKLAGRVGDITRNPVRFRKTDYSQGNFYTNYFDGLYLFRDMSYPAMLYRGVAPGFPKIGAVETKNLESAVDVWHFLQLNGLITSVFEAADLNAKALLRQRLDFMLASVLAGKDDAPAELARLNRQDLRRFAMRHANDLPPEFEAVEAALRAAEQGLNPRLPGPSEPGCFYLYRAAQLPDRDLVNQLLSEFTPLDIRQLFLCNKPAFYKAYQGWSPRKQDYVVEFLSRDEALRNDDAWEDLFGDGTPEEEPQPQAGPWGAIPKG
ncbi:DUF6638 family protein [Labrys sp. La1]|uniref:DUF6638 family protein n=1 Tax=Labrys sp. La1 TaxID=3404917 RepID=UPI003EBA292D